MTDQERIHRKGEHVDGLLWELSVPIGLPAFETTPTVLEDVRIFFKHEIPAGLRKGSLFMLLLAMLGLSFAAAIGEAKNGRAELFPYTAQAWVGIMLIILGIALYIVVLHVAFLRAHLLSKKAPFLRAHATAGVWGWPLLIIGALTTPF